jgi:NADH:ubiquinone reductase (non-electrogenic)
MFLVQLDKITMASVVNAIKPRLVVLGTGWGGFSFLRSIDSSAYDVTILSARDHMVFTPLLCSTAVGTLEHRSILEPVRPLAAKKNMKFMLAEALSVDFTKKVVHSRPIIESPIGTKPHPIEVQYDKLVIAIGALPNTFGIEGVRENAMFMKEVRDGRAVRVRIHACFEAASYPGLTLQEQKNLLTFVVVGGGPTGVELAGELSDYIKEDVSVVWTHTCPNPSRPSYHRITPPLPHSPQSCCWRLRVRC